MIRNVRIAGLICIIATMTVGDIRISVPMIVGSCLMWALVEAYELLDRRTKKADV